MADEPNSDMVGLDSSYPGDTFRKLVEQAADGVLVVDAGGSVRFANSAASTLLQNPGAELVGSQFGYVAVSNEPVEVSLTPAEGKAFVAELRAVELVWDAQPALLINLRDVTTRRQQEQKITNLNSTLHTVLEIQELILREGNRERLLRTACEVLVKQRSYHAASVGLRDERGRVRWLSAGSIENPLGLQHARNSEPLPPCCQHALQKPREIIIWKASEKHCNHCALLPHCNDHRYLLTVISSEEVMFGFLALLVPSSHAENPEELELIRRLAANLGFALRAMEIDTARRETKSQLHRSEARFLQLFENSVDAIVVADETGRYVDVNPAACEMFGQPREKLLAMSISDLKAPSGSHSAAAQFGEFVSTGQQFGTLAFVRSDEQVRLAEYSAFTLAPNRFISILRDVTERHSLEEQLRHSQKMEALGRLAGGVAHDFNNLLTAIITFTGFVRDDTAHGDPRLDDIEQVLQVADRAAGLTRQLLAFSRRQPIAPQHVNLNALLVDIDRLLRHTLGEDIEIVTLPGDDLWPVFIDPGQFEQVVMNLAVNARDAMPSGGKLVIETCNQHDTDPQLDDCVLLSVSDTGDGMTEDVQAQVFEPFFTTKEQGKGTGLGLSMVYGLVAQAGGRISLHSQPGHGTRFELRLARSKGQPSAIASRSPHSVAVASGTILVVEDEPLVRQGVVRILKNQGYTVLVASNGSEASVVLEQAQGRVDLVLCDVVMPQMSGAETVEKLRQVQPYLKVLFMTGYTDDAVVQHGVLKPGVQLLSKPFTSQALIARAQQALESPPEK